MSIFKLNWSSEESIGGLKINKLNKRLKRPNIKRIVGLIKLLRNRVGSFF